MKNQSQRDLEKHWAEQSKKHTPAERLQMKAERLRKQIERDKALLERRSKQSKSQPKSAEKAAPAASLANNGKSSNSKSAAPQRKTKG